MAVYTNHKLHNDYFASTTEAEFNFHLFEDNLVGSLSAKSYL